MVSEIVKVELRPNLRVIDDLDNGMTWRAGRVYVFAERYMRSGLTRRLLYDGDLIVKKGIIFFPIKEARVEIVGGTNKATVWQDGKVYERNLQKREDKALEEGEAPEIGETIYLEESHRKPKKVVVSKKADEKEEKDNIVADSKEKDEDTEDKKSSKKSRKWKR